MGDGDMRGPLVAEAPHGDLRGERGVGSGFSFDAFVATSDDEFVVWSPVRDGGRIVDFVCEFVNPAAERARGTAGSEMLGRRLLDLRPAHRSTGLVDRFRKVVETGVVELDEIDPWSQADRTPTSDRSVPSTVTVSAMGDRLVSVKRRGVVQHEPEPSRRTARRLATVVDSVHDAIAVIGSDGRNKFSNAANLRLLGYDARELEALRSEEIVHPDEFPKVLEQLAAAADTPDGIVSFDTRLVARDGRVIPVHMTITDMSDDPVIDGIILTVRDLTEELASANRLAASEATGRFLTDNSTDLLLRVHESNLILYATTAARSILDRDPDDIVGAHMRDLFADEDRRRVTEALDLAAESGAADPIEARATREDGGVVWVQVTVRAVVVDTDHGIHHEFHVTLSDITQQRADRLALASNERWLRTLVNGAPIGIFEVDTRGRLTFANDRCIEMVGLDGTDRINEVRWSRLVHPDDVDRIVTAWLDASRTATPFEAPARFFRSDGRVVQTELGLAPVLDGDRVVTWLGTLADVTERVELDDARRQASELFVAAFDHAPTGLVLMSVDEFPPRPIKANAALLELTGLTADRLQDIDFYATTHPDDVMATIAGRAALLAGEIDTHRTEVRQRFRPDDEWRWYSLVRSVVRDSDGRPVHLIAQSMDITERKEAEQVNYRLAVTDSLTGLSNRRQFDDRLANSHARLRRGSASIGIVFIDLDHFKTVNDELGHRAGDDVLRQVAEIIAEQVRSGDTVARMGGDEFAVLVEHDHQPEIIDLAERLRAAIDVPVRRRDGRAHRVTASIGIAAVKACESDPGDLLERADEAMYMAKRDGRHRWALAEPI